MKHIKVLYVELNEASDENAVVTMLKSYGLHFITQPSIPGDLDDVKQTLNESFTTGSGIQSNLEIY